MLAVMYNVAPLPQHCQNFYCKSNRFSRLWKRHFLPPLHLPGRLDTTCFSNQLSRWSGLFITGSFRRYWMLAEVEEEARTPYLKVSLSCQSLQSLKDNKFPSSCPLTSPHTAGLHTPRTLHTDNQKVGNFKEPRQFFFFFSQQACVWKCCWRGGRVESSRGWIVLITFCCLGVETWQLILQASAAQFLLFFFFL